MGKVIHEYNGTLMDSNEEVQFAYWLDEAKAAGWVERWRYVTEPTLICAPLKITYNRETKLKTKVKKEQKIFTLLQDLEYTPDFKVQWTGEGVAKLVSIMEYDTWAFDPKKYFCSSDGHFSYIEVKPNFDMHGKVSRFSILQKILWAFNQMFVDLVINSHLFKDTWVPKALIESLKYKVVPKKAIAKGKKKGDFKVDWKVRTIEEYSSEMDRN